MGTVFHKDLLLHSCFVQSTWNNSQEIKELIWYLSMECNPIHIVWWLRFSWTLKSCFNFDCVNGADIGIEIMYGFVSWFHRKIYNANRLINTDLFSEVILHVVSHFGLKLSNAQIINKLLFYLTFSIVSFFFCCEYYGWWYSEAWNLFKKSTEFGTNTERQI